MSASNRHFSFLLCISLLQFTGAGEHQRRLLKYLLEENKHNPLERPVLNDTHTMTISMNLALQQIIDFNEKDEILVISGWLTMTWYDYSLQWKPEDYGGIQTIRIPSARVWTPDVLLYNSADDNFEASIKPNVVVQANGSMLFVPPAIYKSICPFNIAAFPFDIQNCTLKFGSWTFDESGVNLTTEDTEGQLDAYVANGEWDLISFRVVREAKKYDCCPTIYPFILFTIQIRRRTLYYVVNVVVPCVLISFMTVLGFLLPPDSGEKLTLQITILLSIVMFSLLISGIIPASSTALPTIVTYFTTVMGMCSMSVVATVIVLVLHHRNAKNHTMPNWIKVYVNQYLAWFLRMKRPGHDLSWQAIRNRQSRQTSVNKPFTSPLLADSSKSLLANITHADDASFVDGNHSILTPLLHMVKPLPSSNDETYFHRHELRTIAAELRFLTDFVRKEEEEDDISQDWKFSAMVIDRLCLVVFTTMTTIFSYVTLFSAPNFFHFY